MVKLYDADVDVHYEEYDVDEEMETWVKNDVGCLVPYHFAALPKLYRDRVCYYERRDQTTWVSGKISWIPLFALVGPLPEIPYHTAATAGTTLFRILADRDDADAVKSFVENGWIGVNDIDRDDNSSKTTLLLQAVCCCRLRSVRYLLGRHDVHVNTTDIEGWFPLFGAVVFAADRTCGKAKRRLYRKIAKALATDNRSDWSLKFRDEDSQDIGAGESIAKDTEGGGVASLKKMIPFGLRMEKKRMRSYEHILMHIATRKQPDRNELVSVFRDHVRPYLSEPFMDFAEVMDRIENGQM